MMLDRDPHTCCKNCRPPCDVTMRCEACVHLSSDDVADLNKGYLKMAVRRIAQTRVLRRRRTSKDDTLTRLRALESVLQLQSTRGTNLETLLLAEGLPTLPETSGRPSTSTGTFTTFGSSRAAVVGEISDSDSVADDAVRTVSTVSREREYFPEDVSSQMSTQTSPEMTAGRVLSLVDNRKQPDRMSTQRSTLRIPEGVTDRKQVDRMSIILPEVTTNRKQLDRISTSLPEMAPNRKQVDRMSTQILPDEATNRKRVDISPIIVPEVTTNRKKTDRMLTILPEIATNRKQIDRMSTQILPNMSTGTVSLLVDNRKWIDSPHTDRMSTRTILTSVDSRHQVRIIDPNQISMMTGGSTQNRTTPQEMSTRPAKSTTEVSTGEASRQMTESATHRSTRAVSTYAETHHDDIRHSRSDSRLSSRRSRRDRSADNHRGRRSDSRRDRRSRSRSSRRHSPRSERKTQPSLD